MNWFISDQAAFKIIFFVSLTKWFKSVFNLYPYNFQLVRYENIYIWNEIALFFSNVIWNNCEFIFIYPTIEINVCDLCVYIVHFIHSLMYLASEFR